MTNTLGGNWPTLRHYDLKHIRRIALPLGGIGTGTISLGGRGDLRDWEVMNSPAKGWTPAPMLAIYAKAVGEEPVCKLLEGPIDHADYEGFEGCNVPNHGFPRFSNCGFAAAYPLGQVRLIDDDFLVEVRLEAFNPLVPGDLESSGIPVAVLRYVLRNKSDKLVDTSICADIRNFIDAGGNNVAKFIELDGVSGVLLSCENGNENAEKWGSVALGVLASDVTHRTAWKKQGWNSDIQEFWDDFSSDGKLEQIPTEMRGAPRATICSSFSIQPGASESLTLLISWHFPNRMTWTPKQSNDCACSSEGCGASPNSDKIGNYYTTLYSDAWDVVVRVARDLQSLEKDTLAFVNAFCSSNLPDVVKEAALFNLSTLRSQTCFRTSDGRFYGWEGCRDNEGSCHGSCTHVWNYDQATAFLFGDIAKSMREVEFLHATRENGMMSFRVNLPIERAAEWDVAAADGQMGCLMKLYRDWQLSGDDDLLKSIWPKARKALEFCWIPKGWDADQDGIMEGCQHNTMDVEYFGPNPQMGSWYLGALGACEKMARYIGDSEFEQRCRALLESGKNWIDTNLFNGEYYGHEIRPPMTRENIADGLMGTAGATNLKEPDYQLGSGCLVDQLVGQYMAHVCSIGYILSREHVRTTLGSIKRHNFVPLKGRFNHMRSFAMQDESGVLMSTYPLGRRPKTPFPYCNEVMTGFEYTFAAHLLYEGNVEDGLDIITAIRERYDGAKRNPFDEAECGHHYARAMASWALVLALTGFGYFGVDCSMRFAPMNGTWFWSNGYAWGTCSQEHLGSKIHVLLSVTHGNLKLRYFELTRAGSADIGHTRCIGPGESIEIDIKVN